ncbi:MAG: radical SAM protein [Candidatus Saganbacteria bacterium]|nr:radical SAM protein [Candidatus Saganbacteria bacterium]
MYFIIKAIYDCNLACLYCYEKENNKKKQRLSIADFECILYKIRDYYIKTNPREPLIFSWNGGEPLLLGAGFFKKALLLQRKLLGNNFYWRNIIQTNLTLLDSDFLTFFGRHKNKFKLGVSFDFWGQERLFKNGRSSNSVVIRNMNKLCKKKIPFGILSVLTKTNAYYLDEIYSFIRQNPIKVRFLPAKENRGKPDGSCLGREEFLKAISMLTDKWLHDKKALGILENAMNIITSILGGPAGSICYFSKNCQNSVMCIDNLGDVFHCDTNKPDSCYGNIITNSFENILSSPTRQHWLSRPKIINNKICKDCDVLKYCWGGCAKNAAEHSNDIYKKDPMCKTYYSLIHQIKNYLEEEGFINKSGRPTKKAINTFNLPHPALSKAGLKQ